MIWKIYGFALVALNVSLALAFSVSAVNNELVLPAREVAAPGPAGTVMLIFVILLANAIGACRLAYVHYRLDF